MRQKSMTKSKEPRVSFEIPTDRYVEFMRLLREQLETEGTFKANYLLEKVESKIQDGPSAVTDTERREKATKKWLAREELNRATNIRLMFADETDFLFLNDRGYPVSARDVIEWCREQISRLLGESVPWDDLRGSFSGGASTSVRRGVGNVPRKYQEGQDVTANAYWHWLRLTVSTVGLPRDLNLVEGNVMFTVPKTSEIDRVACKEPDLNMYCQKAVGDYIRRRLKTVGINLNDQRINQELAREGSISGELATIDLSSASDSVTKQLVIELLPFEWTSLLLDLRSPITMIDGVPHENEMISSMGNAFTFELESLIFWALTRACAWFTGTRGRVSVYGDDIICPVGLEDALEETFEFFGFTVNREKSFWSGQFRESCGKHWFNGFDVTPFFVKRTPRNISDWCHLLNSLRRWCSIGGICDPSYWPIWSLFAELIPRPLWGAKDLSRIDALCAPNVRCLARVKPKRLHRGRVEAELQRGAYLQWLDATKDREAAVEVVGQFSTNKSAYDWSMMERAVATDQFAEEGNLEWVHRPQLDWSVGMPVFPEEIKAS